MGVQSPSTLATLRMTVMGMQRVSNRLHQRYKGNIYEPME